ncbi:MAG: T9SS type A sorting domain-containing protein [Hyphomicrobiales bacterium]|nr:T9SS type A sorting domain-containing protein [Hyphomicrobiales bacterium]
MISNATIQSPMFKAPTGTLTTNSGADGEWINDSSTGYVGFRFKIGVNNHYGWIELEVTDASSGANMVLIKSWAYNDVADQGLLAGTTIALPVEFVSFDALLINESTHLKWQTASETNNAGFEIERSEDGKNYRSIAWVDGHGTSLEPQEYLFDDKNLRTGRTYYYRLKQVDYDGRFEYSDVVSVSLRSGQDAVGDFFPNPVSTGIASVEINSKEGGEWTADIFDTSGKAIRTEKRFLEVGSAIFRMDMTGLPQGLFFVKFENGGERYYRKLVVE